MQEVAQIGAKAISGTVLLVALFIVAILSLPSKPIVAQGAIEAGSEVEVIVSDGCVQVKVGPYENSATVNCLPGGTRARVVNSSLPTLPPDRWWHLLGLGWVPESSLRVTAPPEPDLREAASPRPFVPGIISYVGEDENIWLGRPGDSERMALTDDATIVYSGSAVHYSDLRWSPDGRFLAFVRDYSGGSAIGLYDAATGELRFINPPAQRSFFAVLWQDGTHLLVTETRSDFHGCIHDTFADQSIVSLDVVRGDRQVLGTASSDEVFLAELGPWSPDGRYLAYAEAIYCEGSLRACILTVHDRSQRCYDKEDWPPIAWMDDEHLVISYEPYEVPYRESMPQFRLFDARGHTRTLDHLTFNVPVVGPNGGQLAVEVTDQGDQVFRYGEKVVLELPAQQSAEMSPQALSARETGFVFALYSSDGVELWLGLTDGSQRAWRVWPDIRISGGPPVIQPRVLLPVLLVHGCGGSLNTWTKPGWLTDTTEAGKVRAGQASGTLHRGFIPELPAVPAYALDYHDSPGSIWDLAALLPQSIDKIQAETGAEQVMVVTHSMGGVLAQAYASGLATGRPFGGDVEAAFMVAPPSRGAFISSLVPGTLESVFGCPQASELVPTSQSIARVRSTALPQLDYTVVSGTRFWLPFVGLNDGAVADQDVALNNVSYLKREVWAIHVDVPLLPNTIGALCLTFGDPCIPELELPTVKDLFRERYAEDMFE